MTSRAEKIFHFDGPPSGEIKELDWLQTSGFLMNRTAQSGISAHCDHKHKVRDIISEICFQLHAFVSIDIILERETVSCAFVWSDFFSVMCYVTTITYSFDTLGKFRNLK